MSVAVAVRADGLVRLAADGWAQGPNSVHIDVVKLLWPAPGVVVAVVGRARALPLLAYHVPLQAPEPTASLEELDAWAQAYAEAATERLVASGCEESGPDAQPGELDTEMLLAWGPHLWELGTNCAFRIERRYHAVGSGAEIALGALWQQARSALPLSPSEAVQAAADLMSAIGGATSAAQTQPLGP